MQRADESDDIDAFDPAPGGGHGPPQDEKEAAKVRIGIEAWQERIEENRRAEGGRRMSWERYSDVLVEASRTETLPEYVPTQWMPSESPPNMKHLEAQIIMRSPYLDNVEKELNRVRTAKDLMEKMGDIR